MWNDQMRRLVANVSGGDRSSPSELVLQSEVILIGELRAKVQIPRARLIERSGPRARSREIPCTDHVREARADIPRSACIEVHVRFDEERRIQRQPQIRASAF